MNNAGFKRKNRKLLFQAGVVIIPLFIIASFLISRMVTVSAFSTSLTSVRFKDGSHIDELQNTTKIWAALGWLIDYWRDHADTMTIEYDRDGYSEMRDQMESELGKMIYDVTEQEIMEMTEEEQARFALYCYLDFQSLLAYYTIDYSLNELLVVLPDEASNTAFVFFDTDLYDDNTCRLGEILSLEELENVQKRFESLMLGNVTNVIKSFPSEYTPLGFSVDLCEEDEEADSRIKNLQIYDIFYIDDVYSTMIFVKYVRQSVINLLVFIAVIILLVLYLIVLRPLGRVKKCVEQYANDKNSGQVVHQLSLIRSRNEVGVLADEFASMATEMDEYTHEVAKLAGDAERVATELNVAARIQSDMLPKVYPDRKEFCLHAVMNPAKEVGGDFYDFYMIDDDHLALTIADVSGKGVPASLFMAVSKTILKNRTLLGGTPGEILADANNQLCEGNDSSLFVTVWLGILTISTGELICANAGHENPGMRLSNEPFKLIKTRHGLALGAFEGLRYRNETYQLVPGDIVFVYTDGVPEANTSDNGMFGANRLTEILQGARNDISPEELLTAVKEAVDDFVGDAPQFDDLTMLAVKYLGL